LRLTSTTEIEVGNGFPGLVCIQTGLENVL
jgi:hypothetical protein